MGVVPVLEHLRHQLVAFDEQPALVVGGEVHRAKDPVSPALVQPGLGGVEQRSGDRRVTLGLVEAEQPPLVVLELVQPMIDVGGDPPDRLAVTPGQEVLGLGVLEERVAAPVEVAAPFGDQRRDPARRSTVQPPREPDEGAEITASGDGAHLDPPRGSAAADPGAPDQLRLAVTHL